MVGTDAGLCGTATEEAPLSVAFNMLAGVSGRATKTPPWFGPAEGFDERLSAMLSVGPSMKSHMAAAFSAAGVPGQAKRVAMGLIAGWKRLWAASPSLKTPSSSSSEVSVLLPD